MAKQDEKCHYSPSEHMYYFAQNSSSNNPGGMDEHHEIIRGYSPPEVGWNTDNMMIALVKDERLANHIAKLLAHSPLKLPQTTTPGA